ncbi:hypothetical protein M433DRAFT_158955, partial [Acidomyces richmondensis BFW]
MCYHGKISSVGQNQTTNCSRTASWIVHLAAAVRPLLDLARSFQFDVPASLNSLSLAS